MATYFLDLDGTLVKHGTNDLLPGARELLDALVAAGHQIVFTTYRGDRNFAGHRVYSADSARTLVRSLRVPYEALILDVDSPRVVVNDGGAAAVANAKNCEWTPEAIADALARGN